MNLFTVVRRNHALEHATIALLLKRLGANMRLIGRAARGGFYIYGNVPTKAVEEATSEALAQLREGKSDLAVSPLCGTNLVVAGVLTGIASLVALGRKNRLQRLHRVILAALLASITAQPLGRLVQKHLTTSPSLGNLRIGRITRKGKGRGTLHKIETIHED